LIGIIDDKHKLKPEKKIFFIIFSSIISLTLNNDLLISDFSFSFYEKRIFLHDFKYVFTIFCILILINSLNFYDGINAQSIIFFIFCFAFLSHKSVIFNFYMIIILVLIFILLLNLLNKCFMGDNGIYLLGSILIISIIYEHNTFKTINYSDEIFLLLILPGFDLVRLTFKRLVRNKNVFYGDRNHIHHILHNKFSLLNTNLILLFLGIMPIFLYSGIKLNFFIVITIFTITYILAINIARSND
jgi:UDP-GlcNAc:undecaprenyl-phosphate GlcNAc-1-phosphate transferase